MSDTDIRTIPGLRATLRQGATNGGAHDADGVRSVVSREPRVALRAIPAIDDSGLQTPDGAHSRTGAVPVRGRGTSGGGSADGHALRQARGRGDLERPNFDIDVPSNGYAWWYVDGISECGTKAVSVIGFIGSVFSPWYAWSGRKDPANHCCINVATYGKGGRFTMTDRGRAALRTSPDTLEVGPSSIHWNGSELVISVDEIASPPLVSRVRGTITVAPSALTSVELPLKADGSHVWRPFAPISDIKVDLEAEGWQWSGKGYFDANFGTRALEQDFDYWTWGCFPGREGATALYDVTRRDGTTFEKAIAFGRDGSAQEVEGAPLTPFKRSLWQVKRETRADPGTVPKQALNMLDAPFYSRSAVATTLDGYRSVGVHEALDLTRFRMAALKPMLAVRVPRRRGWRF